MASVAARQDRTPPGLVVQVPVHGLGDAGFEAFLGAPVELAGQLGRVDGVAVIVARAGQTPRETIGEAKKRLDNGGVKVLGLVLNQRTDPIPDALYQMI